MSQPEFAPSFGITLGTLRHWERGDKKSRDPALVLLEKQSGTDHVLPIVF